MRHTKAQGKASNSGFIEIFNTENLRKARKQHAKAVQKRALQTQSEPSQR